MWCLFLTLPANSSMLCVYVSPSRSWHRSMCSTAWSFRVSREDRKGTLHKELVWKILTEASEQLRVGFMHAGPSPWWALKCMENAPTLQKVSVLVESTQVCRKVPPRCRKACLQSSSDEISTSKRRGIRGTEDNMCKGLDQGPGGCARDEVAGNLLGMLPYIPSA